MFFQLCHLHKHFSQHVHPAVNNDNIYDKINHTQPLLSLTRQYCTTVKEVATTTSACLVQADVVNAQVKANVRIMSDLPYESS